LWWELKISLRNPVVEKKLKVVPLYAMKELGAE
jgi:hypothetical protein